MAPAQVDVARVGSSSSTKTTSNISTGLIVEPLKLSGALDVFKSFDPTPVTGREFPDANIVEWLKAPNADELIRDLAITVAQRGVVFFRAQNDLTPALQKELLEKLGRLTGRPEESGLHINPLHEIQRCPDFGPDYDPQLSYVPLNHPKPPHPSTKPAPDALSWKKSCTAEWHTDANFEPVPADYSCLRMTEFPITGGDTVWASGYELYDRLSEPYQKFLQGLTWTIEPAGLKEMLASMGAKLYDEERGHPLNKGDRLKAIHPCVRTHPITGWNSVYCVGGLVKHINGLTAEESKRTIEYIFDLIYRNHNTHVRFRWTNKNDFAIWDNRCVYHTATYDWMELGDRMGCRGSGVGEIPYLDPNSKSRREDLAAANQ